MEWYDFLREERARKLEAVEQLSSGKVKITWRSGGEERDLADEMVAGHKEHIAEIERILTAAGESVDA